MSYYLTNNFATLGRDKEHLWGKPLVGVADGKDPYYDFLKELNKWIFIDPQFNIVPTLNGIPLNGVEFQKEIFNKI